MMDDGEFDCEAAANEWLLDVVQTAAVSHVQEQAIDVYTFQDKSVMSFKGTHYLVQTPQEVAA
jgi:hypothetical protein